MAGSGLRYHLERDFDRIYICDLKGCTRKGMTGDRKAAAKEGEDVFGSASMSGICMVFLIRSSEF